jgi:SAM-dependent methyltransferase
MKKTYLPFLNRLKKTADSMPNTPLLAAAKVESMVLVNMRYEKVMVNRRLKIHPYVLTNQILQDAIAYLRSWREAAFIEDPSAPVGANIRKLEEKHHDLFQKLWVKFTPEDYNDRIDRYTHRLRVNGLHDGFLKGKTCIDFGCGHGNFGHALLRAGAKSVYGIDFGKESVTYALAARDRLGVSTSRMVFEHGSVYRVPWPDNSFDFAIQNGVFHHLEDEDKAIVEVRRVLKPGGWFWVYTDGCGAISHDLWDASVHVLRNIPEDFILNRLDGLNLQVGKRYHLGDGLKATYRHTSWKEITGRLTRLGFGEFRRLRGGFPTDFDLDAITADKFGKEKFGEGDLRILAKKKA